MEKPLYLQDSPSFVDLCTLHQHAMRYYRLWIYACNTVLALATLVFTVFAVSVLVDPRISLLSGVELYQPTFLYAYVALLLQCGVLQTIGCLGALRLNQKLLNTYWTLLLVLMIGDIVVGLVWAFRLDRIKTALRPNLKLRLKEDYGHDPDFTQVWDWVQSQDMCCGVDGPMDFYFDNEPAFSNDGSMTESSVPYETTTPSPPIINLIPASCCTLFAITNNSHLLNQGRKQGSSQYSSSQDSRRHPPSNIFQTSNVNVNNVNIPLNSNPGNINMNNLNVHTRRKMGPNRRHHEKTDSGGMGGGSGGGGGGGGGVGGGLAGGMGIGVGMGSGGMGGVMGGGYNPYPYNNMGYMNPQSQPHQQSKQSQMYSQPYYYQQQQQYPYQYQQQQTTESSSSNPGVQHMCRLPPHLLVPPTPSSTTNSNDNNLNTNQFTVDTNTNNNNYNTNLKSSHNTKHSSDSNNDVLKVSSGGGGGKTSEESLTSSSASFSNSNSNNPPSVNVNMHVWNSESSFVSSTSASPTVQRDSGRDRSHVGSSSMKTTLTGVPSHLAQVSSSSSSSVWTSTSSTTRSPQTILQERKLTSQQHKMGCADKILEWLDHVTDVLFVIGFCIIVFLKGCFLAILRYEIKEMIQKIRLLNGEDALRSATMNELIGLTSIYDNDQGGGGSPNGDGEGGEGGGGPGGGGGGGGGETGDNSHHILADYSKRHSGGSGGGERTSLNLTNLADTSLSNCTNTKHHYHGPHMGNHVGSNHCKEKLGVVESAKKGDDLIEDDFDSSSALLGRVDSRGRGGGGGPGKPTAPVRTLPKNGNNNINISATNPTNTNNPSAPPTTELPLMASSAP